MHIIVLLLRICGMAFVVLTCLTAIHHLSAVMAMTGASLPLILGFAASALMVYWAYRVIWRPIRRGGAS